MSVQKLSAGRYRVRVKRDGREVYSRVHATRREAIADEAEQVRRLASGSWVDPKAGRVPVRDVIADYLASRPSLVSEKTAETEAYLLGRVTAGFARLPVGAVSSAHVQDELTRQAGDWSAASLRRFRGVLSALFSYAASRRLRYGNPVAGTRVPLGGHERREMSPYTLDELRQVVAELVAVHPDGDLALFLGLTGLRWGEAAGLRVRDVLEVPRRAVLVARSAPTGHAIRDVTKTGRDRVVPVVDDAWAAISRRLTARPDAQPDDLLFTNTKGGRLNGWAWKELVHWAKHARGRRVHDLRHTAATLWLSSGVPPKTVQAWLGHATAAMTLDRYSHYLPNSEAAHGLALMNAALAGGISGARRRKGKEGSGLS